MMHCLRPYVLLYFETYLSPCSLYYQYDFPVAYYNDPRNVALPSHPPPPDAPRFPPPSFWTLVAAVLMFPANTVDRRTMKFSTVLSRFTIRTTWLWTTYYEFLVAVIVLSLDVFALLLLRLAVAVAIDAQTYMKRVDYYLRSQQTELHFVQCKDIRSSTNYAAAMIEECSVRHLRFTIYL